MLRTVIVDDEPIIRMDIESMLQSIPDVEIAGACGSVKDAITLISTLKPDLVLLDIQLSDGNSFEIIDALPGMDCAVIFITAYDKHAIRAIRIGALDYLMKPLAEEELAAAIEKVRKKAVQDIALQAQTARQHYMENTIEPEHTIMLNSQKLMQQVVLKHIIYCEGDGNYTTFHLEDNKKILVSKPLKDYEDLLPQNQFIRTHQSYIINRQFVAHYDRDGMVKLLNGQEVPVSFRKRDQVKLLLNRTNGA